MGLILMGLAALVAYDASHIGGAAGYARIGAATFPYVISAFLAVLGVATVVAAFRGTFPVWDVPELSPVVWIVGGLALQMLLLKAAGFSIATGLLFAMAARGFGRKPFWLCLAVGLPLAFVIYLVFARLLLLSLPAGPIENLIP